MRWFLSLCFVVALSPVAAPAQDQPGAHERAVAAIKRLGGDVRIDPSAAGAPVTVVLTGAGAPGECLPLLKDVKNLQACDL